jgi:pimeloyl-ACP methyl ester carboxylesterase
MLHFVRYVVPLSFIIAFSMSLFIVIIMHRERMLLRELERNSMYMKTPQGTVQYTYVRSNDTFTAKQVIVYVHGAPSHYYGWKVLSFLYTTGQFDILSISRPGYLSTPLSSGYSAKQQASLIKFVVDKVVGKNSTVSVIGFSAGTPVAIEFVKKYSNRVSKLVLFTPVITNHVLEDEVDVMIARVPVAIDAIMTIVEVLGLDRLFLKEYIFSTTINGTEEETNKCLEYFETNSYIQNEIKPILYKIASPCRYLASGYFNDLKIIDSYDTEREDLQSITVPTMIIQSEDDKILPRQYHGDLAAKQIKNSQYILIKGCGHIGK